MTREQLIAALQQHQGADDKERSDTEKTIRFLQQGDDSCFLRTRPDGHITGSGLLVSKNTGKFLLMHHRYIKRWFQFGGHADGDTDILNVAIREAVEESGIKNIVPLVPQLIDVDIHAIPANPVKGEGDHLHYDLRYLLTTEDDHFIAPEGHDMRWLSIEDMQALNLSPELWRLISKARNYLP